MQLPLTTVINHFVLLLVGHEELYYKEEASNIVERSTKYQAVKIVIYATQREIYITSVKTSHKISWSIEMMHKVMLPTKY